MNERYRYGYGEDFPKRDFPFSRQGAMTDQRDEAERREAERREAEGREAEADQRPERDDEDSEELQAERMRKANAADEPRVSDPDATMPFQPVAPEREQPAAPARPPAREDDPDRSAAERAAAETVVAEREDEDRPASGPADADARQPAPPTRRDSIFEVGDEPAEHPDPGPAAEPERPPIALGPPAPAAAPAAPAAAPPTPATGAPAARSVQPAESRSSLLASIDRDSIRGRFVDIQAGFVDEPRQAVQEAEHFVDELVHQLVEALEVERSKLKGAIDGGSTEDLRLALRGYRAFVDRLLNLTL